MQSNIKFCSSNLNCTQTAHVQKQHQKNQPKNVFINSAKPINLNEKIVILLTLRNRHICLCNLWVSGWIWLSNFKQRCEQLLIKTRVISLFISVSFYIFHVFDLCEPLFGKAILVFLFFYFNFSNFTVIFIICFFCLFFYLFNQNDNKKTQTIYSLVAQLVLKCPVPNV